MTPEELKKTDALIFDIDGTLWDSTFVVAEAWNACMDARDMGERHVTAADLKKLFGRTLPDIATVVFAGLPEERQIELIQECCEAEHEALYRTPAPLYPDYVQVLKKLSETHKLFIVSNCQAGYIELFLAVNHMEALFTDHLCPGDTGQAKAANIRNIIERHHLKQAVYIGDTRGDEDACRDAGVPFLHASYGFGEALEPAAVIGSALDLLKLFDKTDS